MTNPIKNEMWGDVSFVIDNHFQLLLYISENSCQLEIKNNFTFLFNSIFLSQLII